MTLSLIHATRVAVETLNIAILTAGMPEPASVDMRIAFSMERGQYERVTFLLSGHDAFSDVETWADYLGVQWSSHLNDEGHEFIEAEQFSADGITAIRVTSNRDPDEWQAEQDRRTLTLVP